MFLNLDKYFMYVYTFKVENTLIEGTVPVHIYMANFGSPLPGVHLLYDIQTLEHMEWGMPNTLVQMASP